MGLPKISAKDLPGNLVEPYLAGIAPRIFMMQPHRLYILWSGELYSEKLSIYPPPSMIIS